MRQVFVSYKRDDEARVALLVRALEREGLSVWWDRGLPGGEDWRLAIQRALEQAACVIVVWSRHSVGPLGDFVRDEAAHAKRRGILVPVQLDGVSPPLGFGEMQSIDLTRWKGRQRDPNFQDVVAVVTAKLKGQPAPPAKGPMVRRLRRFALGGAVTVCAWFVAAFGMNLFDVQDRSCATPVLQPHLSDLCGAIGVGRRPTREERLDWERREPGNCTTLRAHLSKFPDGIHRDEAASLITARQVSQTETWEPATHLLRLFVSGGDPASSEPRARQETLRRAEESAEQLCRSFAATSLFKFRAATPLARQWSCNTYSAGVTCALEGDAQCQLYARRLVEREYCGSKR